MTDNIETVRMHLMGALGTITGTEAALNHGGEVDPIKCLDTIKDDVQKALEVLEQGE